MFTIFAKKSAGFMLGILLISVSASASDNPWEMTLPFKSATIKYELSGMETGNETLYIDKYAND